MTNTQRGSMQVIAVALIAVAVLAGLYFYFDSNGVKNNSVTYEQPRVVTNEPSAAQTANTQPVINNDQDLASSSKDLDAVNMDQIDSGLSQNDSDSQAFAPRIRYKNGTSANWSGYAVETNLTNPQNRAVGDVRGSWTVPALTCDNVNTYSSAWVGIDGYSDNTVEQIGTEQDCLSGQPRYYGWFEMYPKPSFKVNLAIKAGDVISAEVQYLSGSKFQLTLANTTTGKIFRTIQNAKALRQSAEWVMEAPWSGGVLPLANFGTIQFASSQATIGGHTGTISDSAWQSDPITMTNSSGNPKATPSGLSPDGSSFDVVWHSSN